MHLNLDQNFQFVLSFIDADFDPLKRQLGDASVENVERMRVILRELAGNVYYDSRGLERTDKFHLTSDALYDVGVGLGESFLKFCTNIDSSYSCEFPITAIGIIRFRLFP